MNTAVLDDFAEALKLTGDKTAAAWLAHAAALRDVGPGATASPAPLTVRQAALRLGLSTKTIYQLCQAGRLGHFRAGRAVRIPPSEIERYAGQQPPAIEPGETRTQWPD